MEQCDGYCVDFKIECYKHCDGLAKQGASKVRYQFAILIINIIFFKI